MKDRTSIAFDEFIRALAEGSPPDPEEFCRNHPECGPELRVMIHDLLANSGLEIHEAETQSMPAESHPATIGPYRVLTTIGEGGMGVVLLAEQTRPVRRKVALKLIKAGMDSRTILARFDSERQALAMMDHPNVARVYDAGTTKRGQPYFAMEYIKGIPLNDYCRKYRLTIPERLRLFITICKAVQHAHQKAIIHRDLKPSNILVTHLDGKPVPKIIDFGLAKAIDHRLTERSLFTEHGMMVGTPQYMSPEQADPDALDIDTQTDVYSLGVILYQLLVRVLPLEMEGLPGAGRRLSFEKVRRKICETEPPRPSARVSQTGGQTSSVAEARRSDPTALARHLKGDLDWITMKALEKNRIRRYSTPLDLAADIERHFRHEPVLASPPSAVYRLKKILRRHAKLVVSTSVVLLSLAAGTVASTLLYLQADQLRGTAEIALKYAEDAEAAENKLRLEAEGQRNRIRNQRDEILSLSDAFLLSDYKSEADGLWPSYPRNNSDMKDWLDRARILAKNLELHREKLTEIRKQGLSVPGSEGPWAFGDSKTQRRHDYLAELVTGLEAFMDPDPRIGMIASVEARLEFAQLVDQVTLNDYDFEWQGAIASMADETECPAYKGLRITPQIGLIPIGKDPNTLLWEFAHFQTGQIPERSDTGEVYLTEESGLVFVLLPGGEFWMGSQDLDSEGPNYDSNAKDDEAPVQKIWLAPFFLSKYEMTQGQWERFVGSNPSYYHPHNWDAGWSRRRKFQIRMHPVENITWHECASVLFRLGLVLPTEAQWEYGARGGTYTTWWTGNEISTLQGVGNLADAFAKVHEGGASWSYTLELNDGETAHARIGSYRANPFGLHDVIGNIYEWCRDGYKNSYRSAIAHRDGERQVSNDLLKVQRGGSFHSAPALARSSHRGFDPPGTRSVRVGVRPVRLLDP